MSSAPRVPVQGLPQRLRAMGELIAHRGPDGSGQWERDDASVGLVHRRLSVIDLSEAAAQPMATDGGRVITFNGEIYNYLELRQALGDRWSFRSNSDTECILAAYDAYGDACVDHLRGMFAFAIWDEYRQRLFCARDRFGIKPFYYTVQDGTLHFASEAKALLPFLPAVSTDASALAEYVTFQYTIGDKTLFEGVHQLLPGHSLILESGEVHVRRYWDVRYELDHDHSPSYFSRRLRELVEESLDLHLRADVPLGSYVSGGIDSSLVHGLSSRDAPARPGFHGRFRQYPAYDESRYARLVTDRTDSTLHVVDIEASDFRDHVRDVIYHLDFPVAGPGSFPQFMVSRLAGEHVKVVLGGQGGDEMFGGYARYVVAYLEQCLTAAIDGTYMNGNFVVTLESIIPNLGLLREYKPLIEKFWQAGLFEPMDRRYFRLIDRSVDLTDEIQWEAIDRARVFEDYGRIFNNPDNVRKEAYFDKMTHFDFKCLLPALLQVEDRMSMAHGVESRVPFLDHPLVEFAATIPADVKFRDGRMKHLLKSEFERDLPAEVVSRRDKLGFPVPLREWFEGELQGFVREVFESMAERDRTYINADAVLAHLGGEAPFSRKTWGLLSLELWHQTFHDRAAEYRGMIEAP